MTLTVTKGKATWQIAPEVLPILMREQSQSYLDVFDIAIGDNVSPDLTFNIRKADNGWVTNTEQGAGLLRRLRTL